MTSPVRKNNFQKIKKKERLEILFRNRSRMDEKFGGRGIIIPLDNAMINIWSDRIVS
jgi:hypothetical protein